jgi:hypothetical protein
MPTLLNTVDISSTYFDTVSVISIVEGKLKDIKVFITFLNCLRDLSITPYYWSLFTSSKIQNPLLLISMNCKYQAVPQLSSNILQFIHLVHAYYLLTGSVTVRILPLFYLHKFCFSDTTVLKALRMCHVKGLLKR